LSTGRRRDCRASRRRLSVACLSWNRQEACRLEGERCSHYMAKA